MRAFKLVCSLMLLALLATGCIKVEGEIVVEDDGSGNVTLLTAIDSEGALAAIAEEFGEAAAEGSPQDACDEFTEEMMTDTDGLPPGATVSEYEEDGFCGAQVTYSLDASTDHSAQISTVFDGGSPRLFKQDENWIFETRLDTSDITDETEGAPDAFVEELFGDASVRFIVDLPGNAIDGQNNATSVDGGRFTWDIDLNNPEERLFAQTAPGGGGGSGLGMILVIVAVLALLAAAAWWFLTQRKPAADAVATEPMGAAPMGAPPMGATPAPSAAAPPMAATPPIAAEPPVADPVIPEAGTPVTPVTPQNPSVQETVMMRIGDAQDAVEDTAVSAAPVFDESLNAWVIDDPVQGRLVHDAATDTWKPA